MFDLNEELTEMELAELGAAIKAAFDLRKILNKASTAIKKEDAKAAIAALKKAIGSIEKYGEAYGYEEGYAKPKAATDIKKITKLLQKAIDYLDKEEPNFENAQEQIDRAMTELGYGESKAKAAFSLKKTLREAQTAIKKKDKESALEALKKALEGIEQYGYAYGYGYSEGYPMPKAVADTGKIKKLLQEAIDALDQKEPNFDKAQETIDGIYKELGYGYEYGYEYGYPKALDADKLKKWLMQAVGELNKKEPDTERIDKLVKQVLAALGKEYGYPEPQKSLAIKALREEDNGVIIGGYMCLWGDEGHKDLGSDFFTPKTETWHEYYKAVPALFHHGLDDNVGLVVMGHRTKAAPDDFGLWVEDWLDISKKYWKMVKPLLDAEALYYSPGSAPHLVKREKNGELLSFPIVEDTMTPIPMQHRLLPVEQIKLAYKSAKLAEPDLTGRASSGDDGLELAKAKAGALNILIKRKMEIK